MLIFDEQDMFPAQSSYIYSDQNGVYRNTDGYNIISSCDQAPYKHCIGHLFYFSQFSPKDGNSSKLIVNFHTQVGIGHNAC